MDASGKDIDLFTTGEAMGLLLAEAETTLSHASQFTRSVAGSESNVAIGVSRLGHHTSFAGRVGADGPGSWVRRSLSGEGVDVSCLTTDPTRPTGLLLRDAPGPHRSIHVDYRRSGSAACELRMDGPIEAAIKRSRVVFLSGITAMLSEAAHTYVMETLEVAAASECTIVFDPNVRFGLADAERWRAVMSDLVPRCTILMIGEDECEVLGLPQRSMRLKGPRTETVVIKHGSRGATMSGSDGEIHQASHEVPVVDVVGAGDAFAAGWISGWLRGLPAEQQMAEAAWVASCVVASRTDIDGLPSGEERNVTLYGGTDVRR